MKRNDFIKKSAFTMVAASFANWSFAASSSEQDYTTFTGDYYDSYSIYRASITLRMDQLNDGTLIKLKISRFRKGDEGNTITASIFFKLQEDYSEGYSTDIRHLNQEEEYRSYKNEFGMNYLNKLFSSSKFTIRTVDETTTLKFMDKNSNETITMTESIADCYLTTICVEQKGQSDNCYELTTLRGFRDNYMSKTKTGSQLIKDYYDLGPSLLSKINNHKERENILAFIYQQLVVKSLTHIESNEMELAMNYYKDFSLELNKRLSN